MIKNDMNAMPSLFEVLHGLYLFFCNKIDEQLANNPDIDAADVKKQYKDVIDYMLQGFYYRDAYQPLAIGVEEKNSDNDLWNPRGKAVCLIMYMYSIEPPFYAELNNACRCKDPQSIATLGPFATAISYILANAEKERPDRLKDGEVVGSFTPLGFFGGSFFVYRLVNLQW